MKISRYYKCFVCDRTFLSTQTQLKYVPNKSRRCPLCNSRL